MNIEEAIEYAEWALNHGWSMALTIHGGTTKVDLYNIDGDLVWCPDPEADLPKQIMEACVKSHGL